jgi:glucose-1-phosphate adenylyltransferase
MDLLGEKPVLAFDDEKARIFSRHENEAPQYIGAEAVVENSSITEGCEIYGTVINSVLGYGVVVEKGAIVRDSVLMHHVCVGEGATVEYSILDSDVSVGKGARVGRPRDNAEGITVIGANNTVGDGEDIADNQMIYSE